MFLSMIGGAFANEPEAVDLRRAADRIASVPAIEALTRACPADIWKTREAARGLPAGQDDGGNLSACRADLANCTSRCVDGQDGASCGSLAHILETSGVPRMAMAGRRTYALACALGEPSGCTNRAAGIRNLPIPEDGLSQQMTPGIATCLRRSFAIACAAGNAWGCAMEGQALHLGEGGPADAKAARSRFRRACDLSDLHEAQDTALAPCRFAREQLDLLDETR